MPRPDPHPFVSSPASLLAAAWLALLPGPALATLMQVDTPQGRFTCESSADTDYRQVLKLGDKILYRQPRGPDAPQETDLLKDGIIDRDLGCPSVVGHNGGHIVLRRALQPPQYQVDGYLLVDFTQDDPALIDLGTGHRPARNEDVPADQGLRITDGGLVLRYYGDLPDMLIQGDPPVDPAPAARAVLYSFSSGALQDLNTCLPLKEVPLFGDLGFLADAPDPARYLPAGVRIGVPRADVVATLRRYGTLYDPDDTDGGSTQTSPQLTIPLCGDANSAVMPLFLFESDRLKTVRFEGLEG